MHIFKIVLVLFFIFNGVSFAVDYHFANNGNDGTGDGTAGNPFATINKANSIDYQSGDSIRLRPGDTFNDDGLDLSGLTGAITGLTITGGVSFGGRTLAVDGRPFIDGDSHAPLRLNASGPRITNLTVEHIDISGMEWSTGKSSNLAIWNATNIVVDDIYMNGFGGSNPGNPDDPTFRNAKNGINIAGQDNDGTNLGTIEIKNCEIFNLYPGSVAEVAGDVDFVGISAPRHWADQTILIHHNTVHDVNADCLQYHQNTLPVTMKVYNNTFYDCGEQLIDNKRSSGAEIYNNVFYYTKGDPLGPLANNSHIVVNAGEWLGSAGDSLNVSIHDNEFYGNSNEPGSMIGVSAYPADEGEPQYGVINATIYGNHFHDSNSVAVTIARAVQGLEVYNNVFENVGKNAQAGVDTMIEFKGWANSSGNKVYNNTFWSDSLNPENCIAGDDTGILEIYKNICFLADDDGASPTEPFSSTDNDSTLDGNCWWDDGGLVTNRRGNITYTTPAAWNALARVGDTILDKFADPLFINIVARDFRISSASPCQSGGEAWGALGFGEQAQLPPPLPRTDGVQGIDLEGTGLN